MALIECSECEKQVSNKAQACPHCGCPIKLNSCSECGQNFPGEAEACSHCGCPISNNTQNVSALPNSNFCKLCNREVGVEKKRPIMVVVVLMILGLLGIIYGPLLFITLPAFWLLAFLVYTLGAKTVCGICKSPINLQKTDISADVPNVALTSLMVGISSEKLRLVGFLLIFFSFGVISLLQQFFIYRTIISALSIVLFASGALAIIGFAVIEFYSRGEKSHQKLRLTGLTLILFSLISFVFMVLFRVVLYDYGSTSLILSGLLSVLGILLIFISVQLLRTMRSNK